MQYNYGNFPYTFDDWACQVVHILLLKSSMPYVGRCRLDEIKTGSISRTRRYYLDFSSRHLKVSSLSLSHARDIKTGLRAYVYLGKHVQYRIVCCLNDDIDKTFVFNFFKKKSFNKVETQRRTF